MRPQIRLRLRPAVLLVLPVLVLAAAGRSISAPAPPEVLPAPVAGDVDPGVAGDRGDDPGAAAVDAALAVLAPQVRRASHPDALRLAFRAYFNYRGARPDFVRKPYFYYVDLGLDNRTPRGYVFDMDALVVVDGPFTVAHGTGSSRERNGVPTSFSNRLGSRQSSLGLYLAEETYGFSGRAAGGSYTSIGLRMRGESGEFNDAARRRGIVAHGAPYVSAEDAGRSEGCPAMEQHRARRLLPMLADGGVVLIFSPLDSRWLRQDPWLGSE